MIIDEVVVGSFASPLLIYYSAKDSGLFAKGLIELIYLVKDIVAIDPNPIRLSNMKWLLKTLLLINCTIQILQ